MPEGHSPDDHVAAEPDVAATLDIFMAFTELAASETDVLVLSRKAYDVLDAHLTKYDAGYWEVQGDRWKALTWTAEVTDKRVSMIRSGLPLDVPSFVRALETKQPVFIDGWNPEHERIENSDVYGSVGVYPLVVLGEVHGLFSVGLHDGHVWQPRDQALMCALGRSLTLAVERTEQARLQEERTALEAFAVFTEQVGSETDALTLAREATRVMRNHLRHVSAVYSERDGDLWKARVWSEDVAPDVIAQLVRGVPVDAPNLAEAVEQGAVVFADHWDANGDATPTARGSGPVALVPLFSGGEARQLLAVGTQDARAWSERDKAIIRSVGRALGLAIDRAYTARQLRAQNLELEEERAALVAFVALTEAAGPETNVLTLARQAIETLRTRFRDASIGYYTRDGDLWKAQVWSEDMSDALIARLRAGLPDSTPFICQALLTGTVDFTDVWNPEREQIEYSESYGSAAAYPLLVEGEVKHLLLVGLKGTQQWSERDRALVQAVGKALSLVLARSVTTERLLQMNLELDARTRALEGFAALTHELGVQADVSELIRRAQEVVLSLLSAGYMLYYEREDQRWRNRVQVGDVGNADLQAFIDAGPLVGVTPSVDVPWTTQQPLYQDAYAQGSDTPAEMVQHVSAAASLPVMRGGQPVGMFIAVLFEHRAWSREDRVVLETVVRSLGFTLERAEQARQLALQREELEAHNRVLSSFEAWTRDLTEDTDPSELIRRAQALLYELVPVQITVYYEREGDRWWVRSMLGEYGNDNLRQAHEEGLLHELTENLRVPFDTGEVTYLEPYDVKVDGLGEDTSHVRATAMVPLGSSARIRGVLGLARFEQGGWSPSERSLIEAVSNSLRLVLDRADKAAELAAHTAALTDANEELEAFAYSVSHDLRTPVRHIASFNDLLRKQLGGGTDPKTTRYLTVIGEAAQRMNGLIDAMLDLSRTSRLPLRLGVVDLEALVQSVRLELDADTEDRDIKWRVAALPLAQGDHSLLRQVLFNLLGNAVKYTRGREQTIIEVGVEERHHEVEVWVRDNGAGFDPRYANKLFGVFQRLHRTEEFEGTGVGLANVRRIVQRHGGTVSASGVPGEGATFRFTLPKPS